MPQNLPIAAVLPQIKDALAQHSLALLQAPTGSGKSTALPLELLAEPWLAGQRVLMLQPRRLAVRAVAARLAAGLAEAVGQTVGYRMRFESRISAKTRLEVLTEGILTRRLQHDPELAGIGLVLLDEFHERSLHADLALALLREVQGALRPDLRILLMSATLDPTLSNRLAAPLIQGEGRSYPVEICYLTQEPAPPLTTAVVRQVRQVLVQDQGDILVFLAGVAEIRKVLSQLNQLNEVNEAEMLVLPLYGDLPVAEQQRAILPDPAGRRRVILATSIAETSLTIQGVRVVIDSGQSRGQQFDPASGLTRMVTQRLSQDSAQQRSGRAGRTSSGKTYRLWTQNLHALLPPAQAPEIMRADLAPLCLELAAWGAQAEALEWLDAPPAARLQAASELLHSLGALTSAGQITASGRQLLQFPTHPRLAHLLAMSRQQEATVRALAADLVALLDERDPLPADAGADLGDRLAALQAWRRGESLAAWRANVSVLQRVQRLAKQWRRLLKVPADLLPTNKQISQHTGQLLALAYPERLALARQQQRGRFVLVGGGGAMLPAGDELAAAPALAVAHLDMRKTAGITEGRIFLAAPLELSDLRQRASWQNNVIWDVRAGELLARRELRLGAVLLEQQPVKTDITAEAKAKAICVGIRTTGMHLLNFSPEAEQFCARVESLRAWRAVAETGVREEWPDWPQLSQAHLLETLEQWLAPYLAEVRTTEDLARLDLLPALQGLLAWPLPQRLNELTPTHLLVPTGRRVRLSYSLTANAPILAVKLQELFGLADTPTVNAGRTPVLLHLLSPAGRVVQITQDLRSFWNSSYFEVRKDLRGRYPKHPWPEDPWNQAPTKDPKRRG